MRSYWWWYYLHERPALQAVCLHWASFGSAYRQFAAAVVIGMCANMRALLYADFYSINTFIVAFSPVLFSLPVYGGAVAADESSRLCVCCGTARGGHQRFNEGFFSALITVISLSVSLYLIFSTFHHKFWRLSRQSLIALFCLWICGSFLSDVTRSAFIGCKLRLVLRHRWRPPPSDAAQTHGIQCKRQCDVPKEWILGPKSLIRSRQNEYRLLISSHLALWIRFSCVSCDFTPATKVILLNAVEIVHNNLCSDLARFFIYKLCYNEQINKEFRFLKQKNFIIWLRSMGITCFPYIMHLSSRMHTWNAIVVSHRATQTILLLPINWAWVKNS